MTYDGAMGFSISGFQLRLDDGRPFSYSRRNLGELSVAEAELHIIQVNGQFSSPFPTNYYHCMTSNPPSLRHLKPKALEVTPIESGSAPRRPLFPISSEKPVDMAPLHVHQSSRQKSEHEHEIDGLKQLLFAKSEEMIRHDLNHLLETGRMKREIDRLSAELSTQREEIHGLKTELLRTRQLHESVGFSRLDLSDKPSASFHTVYAPRCTADREVIEVRTRFLRIIRCLAH